MSPDARNPHRRAALAVVTCLLLAGCTADHDHSRPTATHTTASSPSATSPSAQDVAVAAAEKATRSYYTVTDRLLSDSTVPIDQVTTVAGGDELDELREQLQAERVRGLHQTGTVDLVTLTPTSVDLSTPTTVTLDACVDVSGVDVVDSAGHSQVAPGRAARSDVQLTVVDRAARGWLVEQTTSHGDPCTSR